MPIENQSTWQVELRAAPATDKLEIAVHDVIGKSLFDDGITSKDFLSALRSVPKAKAIDLRINSLGGIVDQAKAMGNLLAERAASGVAVTGYVDGIAASSGSYLLTFAQRVVMPSNTFQMLHQARGGIRGNADELENAAKLMRRINEQLAEGYAAASARRGKDKTKEDFLALFAEGDTYLDADEAIEWGLADEKLEPLKVAACLVDLGDRAESAPEAVKSAPYVAPKATETLHVDITQGVEFANAAVEAIAERIDALVNSQTRAPTSARPTNNKEIHMDQVIQALALGEGADEAAIVAAVKKLQVSARIGGEIEKLVGATGDSALGAVRALKEAQGAQAELAAEVEKLKVTNARRDFDASLEKGRTEKKLTPAVAKMYGERFSAAVASGADGSAVVADLQGFLAVAPPVVARIGNPGAAPTDPEGAPLKWQGKTFAELAPMERHNLKAADAELYALMRRDWETANR